MLHLPAKKYIFLTALTVGLASLTLGVSSGSALSGSQFNAGRIIDDFVFSNKNSLTANDVQNFLNAKVPTCDTNGTQNSSHWNSSAGRYYTRAEWGSLNGEPAPYICLKDYYENPTTHVNNLHGAAIPAGARSAAQLIMDVSQQYNINPEVLIVLLQKEQALVSDDWPWSTQYRSATGYGCPDTAPCDSQYYGFYNQISNAAWQFNYYASHPTYYNYQAGRNNYIQYNPNSNCGGSTIYIQNQATAGLYIYTPYQPNAAALNNLYGTGDSCSAYGNRNFWRLFNDWFGNTYANDSNSPHPDGTVISDTVRVYIMDGGIRHHVVTPRVLSLNNFTWNNVKDSTTGDRLSDVGTPYTLIPQGTIFRSDDGVVYVMDYDGTDLKKWHLTYASYVALGYDWNEVAYIPSNETPAATAANMFSGSQHPSGTLVVDRSIGSVYIIDKGTRKYVSAPVFTSWGYSWNKIKTATSADLALPQGSSLDYRKGTILNANGLYVVDYDQTGQFKRPIGPWECYADRMHYTPQDWLYVTIAQLPARTGSTFTC